MGKFYDLARMTTATTGTGTVTLGSAVTGFLTFALAGVSDGDVVDYAINDPGTAPTASEIGTGTYTAAGTTLSRTPTKSTNSNAAINLSGSAHVFICPRAEDMVPQSIGQLPGTATNDNASAGNVGEYISATIASGSAISLTTATNTNVTSISLTAGDWDISETFEFNYGTTTQLNVLEASISLTSATVDSTPGSRTRLTFPPGTVLTTAADVNVLCGPVRQSLATTTTVFAVANALFAVSTLSVFGIIRARRVR